MKLPNICFIHSFQVPELKALNGRNDVLFNGQIVFVKPQQNSPHLREEKPQNLEEYTVSQSDTLSSIALQFGTTVEHFFSIFIIKFNIFQFYFQG